MKFFRNTELAELHHISEKSVRNWVEAARAGKLNLQLCEKNGKCFIADSSKNMALIEQLVEKGKKYKNNRALRKIKPRPKFYDVYDQKQIVSLLASITTYNEIPLQYSYLDGGADYWDAYANRLVGEESPNLLNSTISLLNLSMDTLDQLLNTKRKINIVDLGPGNGLPVKHLLNHFLQREQLKGYIAVDISQGMLNIAEKHIKQWFGDKVKFEGHAKDFSNERFDDIFADDYIGDDADIPINIVLLLGGTLCNFRSPSQALQTINSSLGPNDLLVYSTKLDTPNTRRHFDLGIETRPKPLDFLFKVVIDMLGIEDSLYEVDQFFDEIKRARFVSIRPKVDIAIEFTLPRGTRIVTLRKNEPLLLWRYWHQTANDVIDQFDQNGFDLMQATKTSDKEYLSLVSKIKSSK